MAFFREAGWYPKCKRGPRSLVSSAGQDRCTFFQIPNVMESGPGAALLEERERDWVTSPSLSGKQSGKGDSVTSAIAGGGGVGKKWESRAWLMPSGVSWAGNEGKRESWLPLASFLAVQTVDGVREDKKDDQC